ncbi:excinuclease ABC subunit UvrC [Candidatus Margulisiibacteriota bacterium]
MKQKVSLAAANLPTNPGIYLMYNAKKELLYIGKAKNLKKRAASYFQNKSNLDLKTQILVKQIFSIETIITENEKEAFILEKQLIKKYKPHYNIDLKDDKSFPYVKITIQDFFPKIEVLRNKIKDGSIYFGPLPGIGSSKHLKKILQELFLLRDCKQKIDQNKKQKKCINLDIGRCLGPCIYKDVKPAYDANIQELILLLTGKNKTLIQKLKYQMKHYSENLEFEKAGIVKNKITKIQNTTEKQMVSLRENINLQVWAAVENDHLFYVIVQNIHKGNLISQQGFYLKKSKAQNIKDFYLKSFLNSFSEVTFMPDQIICDKNLFRIIKNILPTLALTKKVKPLCPYKGKKKELLAMAQRNALLNLKRISAQFMPEKLDTNAILKSIQNKLLLSEFPKRIIGFDISHLSGENIVGTSVYFEDGKPNKSKYRKFNIRSVQDASNDPEAIYETVLRRLNRVIKDKEIVPNLLLIDGGRAQLNYAKRAVLELGFNNLDVIALAKKNEELYYADKKAPLALAKNDPGLKLLQRIRNEVHRFTIGFQRQKRKLK